MLNRFKKTNNRGFTLIELMIVIAIIGILAAIAIPNFIAYRNKSFCSTAESDANSIATAIYDYYAVPNRLAYPPTIAGDLGLTLSNGNVAVLGGNIDGMVITLTDGSGRCPVEYTGPAPDWAASVFTKTM